jgi:hypothetical protein
MRFDVKFSPRSFTRNVDILGPGAVYLDEIGIVVEGDFPRFYIPFVQRVLRKIICAKGVCTIPFSRIVSYVRPSIWNNYLHGVVYLQPDQSKRTVSFKMRGSNKKNDAEFSARFHEYRAAVQSFSLT